MTYSKITDISLHRLTLRRLKITDAKHFYRFASNKNVSKYMLWVPHKSIEESMHSIERSITKYEEGKYYRWGIALKDSDVLIGIIQLLSFDETHNSCSFAYMLGEEYWGNGYGCEALSGVINYAFNSLGIDTIKADHFSQNIASGKVMRKCGMTHIGTSLKKYEKNGVLFDTENYVILRTK